MSERASTRLIPVSLLNVIYDVSLGFENMPIRNLWSLEPGECITAEKIFEVIKDCEVYFPLRDVGVDLMVVKGKKYVGIQVKESRYYTLEDHRKDHSWHDLSKKKFERDRSKIDFYVFLTYVPMYGEHKLSSFEHKFVIVPPKELAKRLAAKSAGKRGVYAFYFHFEGEKVIDRRVKIENELMDYSQFLDAWNLVEEALK